MMKQYQVTKDALKGKIILVTGAGAGLGRQAALSFASHGATLILLGRTVNKLEATYDEILHNGGEKPAIIPLNLLGASEKHYQDMAATIADTFGQLDGVLHSASELGVLSTLEQTDLKSFEEVMKVNVTSQFMMTKALLPLLKQAEYGRIVLTSSSVGKKGRAFWGAYAISKFATEGMMQVWADELEKTAIRVNCINPGATQTAMRAKAYPAEDASKLKKPLDLMPLYLYLMSADSQHINGQSIDALVQCLADSDDQVGFQSGLSLARIGTSAGAAVPALQTALKHENRYVRANAVEALNRIATPDAQRVLMDYLLNSRWCPTTTPENTF